MIKNIFFVFFLGISLHVKAYDSLFSDSLRRDDNLDELLQPIEPVYLDDAIQVFTWKSNWFVDVSGGMSAFIGSPVGCEDLFGRIKPVLAISTGKWLTPAIGGRVAFQGFQFKDAMLKTRHFQHIHADLLWNVLAGLKRNEKDFRWKLIPYMGLGVLHNDDNGNHPFAISYGIQGKYRLTDRLHLTAELGSTATFKDFDGYGAANGWGDRLVSFSAGLSLTLGKTGWKRIVDATPYVQRSEQLAGLSMDLSKDNAMLRQKNKTDESIIVELKKILELEGLLDRYSDRINKRENYSGKMVGGNHPKNDYSGLNSLRARLKASTITGKKQNDSIQSNQNKISHEVIPSSRESTTYDNDSCSTTGLDDDKYIGPPIYFFFALNTDKLTDKSQLINLDGIARIAQKHKLHIQIIGSADSATGNAVINENLASRRAEYIARQLAERGILTTSMSTLSVGGTEHFSPGDANRNACVRLLPKLMY